jgi:hypothetical protein
MQNPWICTIWVLILQPIASVGVNPLKELPAVALKNEMRRQLLLVRHINHSEGINETASAVSTISFVFII